MYRLNTFDKLCIIHCNKQSININQYKEMTFVQKIRTLLMQLGKYHTEPRLRDGGSSDLSSVFSWYFPSKILWIAVRTF